MSEKPDHVQGPFAELDPWPARSMDPRIAESRGITIRSSIGIAFPQRRWRSEQTNRICTPLEPRAQASLRAVGFVSSKPHCSAGLQASYLTQPPEVASSPWVRFVKNTLQPVCTSCPPSRLRLLDSFTILWSRLIREIRKIRGCLAPGIGSVRRCRPIEANTETLACHPLVHVFRLASIALFEPTTNPSGARRASKREPRISRISRIGRGIKEPCSPL